MSERERLLREVQRYEGYLRECESYIAEESKWPEMQESFIYYLTSYHQAGGGQEERMSNTTAVETCKHCGNKMHYRHCICDKSQLVRAVEYNNLLRAENEALRHQLDQIRMRVEMGRDQLEKALEIAAGD